MEENTNKSSEKVVETSVDIDMETSESALEEMLLSKNLDEENEEELLRDEPDNIAMDISETEKAIDKIADDKTKEAELNGDIKENHIESETDKENANVEEKSETIEVNSEESKTKENETLDKTIELEEEEEEEEEKEETKEKDNNDDEKISKDNEEQTTSNDSVPVDHKEKPESSIEHKSEEDKESSKEEVENEIKKQNGDITLDDKHDDEVNKDEGDVDNAKNNAERETKINDSADIDNDDIEIIEQITNTKVKPSKDKNNHEEVVLFSDLDSSRSSYDDEEYEDDQLEDSDNYDVIEEGKAKILVPKSKQGVFYNPAQEFNRDLSICVLNVFAKDHLTDPTVRKYQMKKRPSSSTEEDEDDESNDEEPQPGKKCRRGVTVLDALSATGLRAMRYGLEIPGINTVMANDMSEVAVKIIDKNIRHNNLKKVVSSRLFDAVDLMQLERINGRHFDAIDLDPFGNPCRFLDSAVGAVRDGGILMVTCTDMAVLCGNTPESCYVKYNSISLKTAACHEMALRICLHAIETACSTKSRYIVPLLSFHADYYIRVFVKVFTSPQTCKSTCTKTSMVFKCIGCNTLSFQPLGMVYEGTDGRRKFNISHGPVVNQTCLHCDGRHVMAGPIWTGPLHKPEFVQKVLKKSVELNLKTTRRIVGMLSVILEELQDVPLYYTLTNLCSVLHCEVIPMQEFRSALLNANYKVSLSHSCKNSFKTDAPMYVIWDILRCWIKDHPISEKRWDIPTVNSILSKEPTIIADFTFHEKSISESAGLLRYQPNPQPFWGPGRKSTTGLSAPKSKKHRNEENNSVTSEESISDETPPAKKHKNEVVITLSDDDEEENGPS